MNDDARRQLAAEIRETVPRSPGVYAFLDAHGQLLYIGKSVDLRQRMSSYFRQEPLAVDPHLGRLTAGIRSFAWWRTLSELLALLMEDVLIKEYMPPGNTRLKEMAENRYLELTEDVYPTCRIVEHVPDFGAREVFGPFKDKYFAERLRGVIHETLGVRTCREPEPKRRCLEHDIGRCSGPCRGETEPDEYGQRVSQAREFLNGEAATVLRTLTSARDLASLERHYEEAARLQDTIDMCTRFEAHQQFAGRFTEGELAMRCSKEEIDYVFSHGALVAPRSVIVGHGQSTGLGVPGPNGFHPVTAGRRADAMLRLPPSADRRFLADRTRIVGNWVHRRCDGCQTRRDEVLEQGSGECP